VKLVIASDHAGRNLRRQIREHLEGLGHEIVDLGTDADNPVDYPDFALTAARRVARGESARGILICGTGYGMQIAANKVRGIRAVAPCDEESTRMSRLHNDANVVCFGERLQDPELVLRLADLWLDTPYEGGRHDRRLEKIRQIECAADSEPEPTDY